MKALNAAGQVCSDLTTSLDYPIHTLIMSFSKSDDNYASLFDESQVVHPSSDPKVTKYHDAKYRIFRNLYEQQLSHRSIIAEALA